jgi:peptidoglycan/LPS O-acetylase OafA/YrhL
VISGFLMAHILVTPGKKPVTFWIAINFYYRRIKRIFPAYLLVIISTLITALFVVYPLDKGSVFTEAKHSLLLVLNLAQLWTKFDYFALVIKFTHSLSYTSIKLEMYKFLTHLWSLCAEIQFYLIVPLIFFLLFKVNHPLRIIFCLSVIFSSYAQQILLPDIFQHAFTPVRFWQFFCGILCFYVQVNEWEIKGNFLCCNCEFSALINF